MPGALSTALAAQKARLLPAAWAHSCGRRCQTNMVHIAGMLSACLRGIWSSQAVNKQDETNFTSPPIPSASTALMKEDRDS